MRVFVYEFVTGGGWFLVDPNSPPAGSLLCEGMAMLRAIAEDFSAIPEVEAVLLWDARLPKLIDDTTELLMVDCAQAHDAVFRQAASTTDYALLIAPEFDQHLARVSQMALDGRGRCLSPDAQFVQLASDKQRTIDRLVAGGVPVPHGVPLNPVDSLPLEFPYPGVLKPRDGAGSQDVRLIADLSQAAALPTLQSPSRLEVFCPGTPASVSALCGPAGNVLLPAMRQILSNGSFAYLGGDNHLKPAMQQRAHRLAKQALAALPRTCGYVGIDMVLGEAAGGSGDVIIEVNPRLTTSYVGLRKICCDNLAGAMLEIASGNVPELSWRDCKVKFSADGDVAIVDASQ